MEQKEWVIEMKKEEREERDHLHNPVVRSRPFHPETRQRS